MAAAATAACMLGTMPTTPLPRQVDLRAGLMPRRGYLLALAVLVGSLLLVLAAWRTARERELRAAEMQFESRATEMAERIQRRLNSFELVARGGTSLFATVARPTPRQWADYVEGMNLPGRFPSAVGLGFAGRVSSSQLVDLQLEWRDAGYGQLVVRPHGVREHYGPTLYLEPRTAGNIAAIGFDLLTDPVRGDAMRRAMETGLPRLSGRVAESDVASPGLVLFVPVYRSGDRPGTPAARAASMQGWVYLPFRIDRFVEAALGSYYGDAGLRVVDITGGGNMLLHVRRHAHEDGPVFHGSRVIDLHGRRWRLDFTSPPATVAASRLGNLENMLALGLVACLLLYGMVWLLARTEDRAHAIALRLTEDYRRSEQRFRSSMQYSAIGKALLDSGGRIVDANPALARIVGRPLDALLHTPFDALFEDASPGPRERDYSQPDADGAVRVTRHLSRPGELPRQAQLTYAPLPGAVGEDVAGLVQVEDVTERIRAEARVQALNRTLEARVAIRTRELRQANEELESFAYSVSHDLRAPLRAIDGFSRILVERYADQLEPAARDYLDRVRKAAGRMGELIDAILAISRLSRAEFRRERVDLSHLAAEVVDELRADDPSRDVEVRIAPGLEALGDATLLRNLLVNLLGNAWKFTRGREDAWIEFGATRHEDGEVEFHVHDNGAGFDPTYGDKLFRPFQRLHSQQEFSGHGIGLASVKRIIERHGGRIRAEGEVGEGATFHFTLPAERNGEE